MNINFLLQLACVTQECSTYLNSTHTFLICLKQMYYFARVLRFSALRANKTRHVTGLKPNKSEQRQRQGCQSALIIDCWWVQHIPASEPSPFPGGQEGWTCLLSPDSSLKDPPGLAVDPQQIVLCRYAVELHNSLKHLSRAAFPFSILSYLLFLFYFRLILLIWKRQRCNHQPSCGAAHCRVLSLHSVGNTQYTLGLTCLVFFRSGNSRKFQSLQLRLFISPDGICHDPKGKLTSQQLR